MTLGFASDLLAGLVAITPAAGFAETFFSSTLIGLVAGVVCHKDVSYIESGTRFG